MLVFERIGDQSVLIISLEKDSLFAAQWDLEMRDVSKGIGEVWYLIKKTGKWSLISQSRIPLLLSVVNGMVEKILSIRVADLSVILVGLFIKGNKV